MRSRSSNFLKVSVAIVGLCGIAVAGTAPCRGRAAKIQI